jgi:hypothetical protein
MPNQGLGWVGEDSHFVFRQKLLGDDGKYETGRCLVESVFSQKFGATSSHVFTQSPQNVAVEPGIHFGLFGPVLRATTTAV